MQRVSPYYGYWNQTFVLDDLCLVHADQLTLFFSPGGYNREYTVFQLSVFGSGYHGL